MLTGATIALAVVTHFTPSKWHPKTRFRGCRIFTESQQPQVVSPDTIVRGIVMCPVFAAPPELQHGFYLMDTIGGGDMFLRLNQLSVPELLQK